VKRWVREVERLAREAGLVVHHAHNGHLRLIDPTTGVLVATASSTPTNSVHALAAIRRDLRRYADESSR
jgi:hypothetical protein